MSACRHHSVHLHRAGTRTAFVLLVSALSAAGCASTAQVRWQPSLVLAGGLPSATAPRVPVRPVPCAVYSDVPAPRGGSSAVPESEESGGNEVSGSGGEPEDDGGHPTFTAEEDE